jgi:phosphoenolpyruvate synthase/pyruvate phosphate dikinase
MATSATATAEFVRDLTALSRGDVAFAGGKGANLGELTRA